MNRVAPIRATAIAWRLATIVDLVTETPTARTLALDIPGWPGHRAGQHVDVRVTAEDGYQTQRSYSIASAPEDPVAVAAAFVDLGHDPALVKTERFGPTGDEGSREPQRGRAQGGTDER